MLYLSQLCSLFKLAGISMDFVMINLFSLSLKDKALDLYRLLDDSRLLNWQDLCLSFMQSFILFMKYIETGTIFITFGLVMEKESLNLGGD